MMVCTRDAAYNTLEGGLTSRRSTQSTVANTTVLCDSGFSLHMTIHIGNESKIGDNEARR